MVLYIAKNAMSIIPTCESRINQLRAKIGHVIVCTSRGDNQSGNATKEVRHGQEDQEEHLQQEGREAG